MKENIVHGVDTVGLWNGVSELRKRNTKASRVFSSSNQSNRFPWNWTVRRWVNKVRAKVSGDLKGTHRVLADALFSPFNPYCSTVVQGNSGIVIALIDIGECYTLIDAIFVEEYLCEKKSNKDDEVSKVFFSTFPSSVAFILVSPVRRSSRSSK